MNPPTQTAVLGKTIVRRKDGLGPALSFIKFSDRQGLAVFDGKSEAHANCWASKAFAPPSGHRGAIYPLTYQELVDVLEMYDEIEYVFINPTRGREPGLLAYKEDVIEAIENMEEEADFVEVEAHRCFIDYLR